MASSKIAHQYIYFIFAKDREQQKSCLMLMNLKLSLIQMKLIIQKKYQFSCDCYKIQDSSIEIVVQNFKMNYRNTNHPSYYQNVNPKLGYSNVSKGFGYSNRNNPNNDDHNYGELEFMLQNQRKKFKETKEKYEHDLDNERKLRIEFENKLIKLKDEFSRKDINTSELEFKINNLLHQNQDLCSQNAQLKHQLARLQELYGSKINELETQLAMETKNFEETTLQYNSQFQKFKKEGQDYVEQLTFQFDRKIKNLQEKNKSLEMTRKDLTMENKKLNDILISNKLAFQQEIRDLKNRMRDEQVKRTQQMTRSFEQKLKMVQQSKEVLVRKNQELLRALQEKERQIGDLDNERTEEINKLRQDCSDLHQQNNHLNYLLTKVKQELAEKDNMIGRSLNNNDAELNALKQQLQQKKQEISQLSSTLREIKMNWKQSEGEWQRKRRQLAERLSIQENEARKYKQQYLRICEVLKSKINSAIDNVSYKK